MPSGGSRSDEMHNRDTAKRFYGTICGAGMNNQQVQQRGGISSRAATLRQKEKTPAVAVLNKATNGGDP